MEPSFAELLLSGLKLMIIGMSIVFLFLALLVWIIGVTARLMQRYSPEAEPTQLRPMRKAASEPEQAELIAAITAAIHRYRNR